MSIVHATREQYSPYGNQYRCLNGWRIWLYQVCGSQHNTMGPGGQFTFCINSDLTVSWWRAETPTRLRECAGWSGFPPSTGFVWPHSPCWDTHTSSNNASCSNTRIDTVPLALISSAVVRQLGNNSICILEIKELDWLSLSCVQAPPVKLIG